LESDYGWRKHYDALVYKTPEVVLVKTKDIFMNESGRLLQGLPEGEVYVAHDDLDIRLGEYKIQKGKGPKEHNGVESVEKRLGTKDFWRIRIGIDNRMTPGEGETYVLQKFSGQEREAIDEALEKINEITTTTQ
jgi:PTH1 family peptidyl-tRNA hydrolase